MGIFCQFKLPLHTDNRFTLIPFELKDQVLFEVRRVYAIVDAQAPTGAHCHKTEEEYFICFQGSVTAEIDDGTGKRDVVLGQGDGIYVGTYVWHHFKNFARNTVLVALSSTNYNATRTDYIINYNEFKQLNDH